MNNIAIAHMIFCSKFSLSAQLNLLKISIIIAEQIIVIKLHIMLLAKNFTLQILLRLVPVIKSINQYLFLFIIVILSSFSKNSQQKRHFFAIFLISSPQYGQILYQSVIFKRKINKKTANSVSRQTINALVSNR